MTKGKQSLRPIALDLLVSHQHNRALNPDRVDEMAKSIEQVGMLSPLVVTEHLTEYDRFLLLDGHHRAAAARKLGLQSALCFIRHGLDEDSDEQLLLMVIGNCQRNDMTPMDRAEWFGLLRRTMTVGAISARTGLSEGRIYESLSLLDLDAETRAKVRAGEVQVGLATQAIRQVRAAVRTGSAIGKMPAKPRVTAEPAHFTGRHPLAETVRKICDHRDASAGRVRPSVGGVGCGQCWEQAIRSDASGGTS